MREATEAQDWCFDRREEIGWNASKWSDILHISIARSKDIGLGGELSLCGRRFYAISPGPVDAWGICERCANAYSRGFLRLRVVK